MDILASLQLQLQSLEDRIKELESENAKLSAQLSNCHCQKSRESDNLSPVAKERKELKLAGDGGEKDSKETSSGPKTRVPLRFHKRYVALKIMYFGQRYYGFASEAQMDPTVESEIFKALKKTRLIVEVDKKELQYSRCGRTDKGVSSVGQVIALFLRSKHMETRTDQSSPEISSEYSCGGEMDYVGTLNRALPNDIRVMGWSPAPNDFSARFSCLSRVYKYFFWRDDLNIEVCLTYFYMVLRPVEIIKPHCLQSIPTLLSSLNIVLNKAMKAAGKRFVGERDFRNFCKMDATNVHNYRRRIMLFEIIPCSESFGGDDLWVIKIEGSAFLWHQIRCMAALLFLIGQGLESPNLVDLLLDVERTPRKPQYAMAPEIPLVLESCEFGDLRFICSPGAKRALCEHLKRECRSYKLQSAIFQEALQSLSSTETDEGPLKNDRFRKKEPVHISVMSRPTEPSYEERRAKFMTVAEHKSRSS